MSNSQNQGRLILTANGVQSTFTGPHAIKPKHEEIAYDEKTRDLVLFLEDEFGNMVEYNTIAELREYITTLKNSGIFTSAAAFVNNRKIYRFYFDMNNGTARLDSELRFDPLYRYYAIREISLGNNGEFIYVTGVRGTGTPEYDFNGNEIGVSAASNLVDMNIEDSESGDGTQVSVPQVGGIVREIMPGNTYTVEFYDANRVLVNTLSFQAIAVRVSDLDLSPDTAVVDMYIRTNRPMTNNTDACFLYRGENTGNLDIRVFLKYADGRTRDVTFENVINGRLVIQGLDEINSDIITGNNDAPQHFRVTYTLIRTNASLPPSSTETPEGAVINPMSLTISKDVDVYILEDIFSNLEKIIPAAYVTQNQNTLEGEIAVRFFGLYESGNIYDITNICMYTNANGLQKNNFGVEQNLSIQIPYGNAGSYKSFNFTLYCAMDSKNVKINTNPIRVIYANLMNTGGGLFSGSFIGIGKKDENNNNFINEDITNLMVALEELTFHGITPNYFRVRDVIDSSYTYTEEASSIGPGGLGYLATQGHEPIKDKPVLIEFFRKNTDGQGNFTNIYKTGALVFYIIPQY
jgi:hypothetical protein